MQALARGTGPWRQTVALLVCSLVAATAWGQGQTPEYPGPAPELPGFVQQLLRDGATTPQAPTGTAVQPEMAAGTATGAPGAETEERKRQGGRVHIVGATGGSAVQMSGQGANEAIFNFPVEYGEVPDEGQAVTILGQIEPIPVMDFLDQIAAATKWNIVVTESVGEKRVRCILTDARPREALTVLRAHGLYYEFDPATKFLRVSTIEEYLNREYGTLEQDRFTVQHAEVVDMQAILTTLLSQKGRLVSDPRTGSILVTDTAANLAQMRDAVARLDQPLDPMVHQLHYMQAEGLLEAVTGMLSERGIAYVDTRVNAMVVTDLPSRQARIREILDALDQQLETRTWTLNHADAKEIAERLENVVPEEMGMVTSDERAHQVTVTAIPARIEEIDSMIRAWDVKGRQVDIQAYLVSASTQVTRNLGISWAYFDDIAGDPFAIWSGNQSPNYVTRPDVGQRLSVGRMPYEVPLFTQVPFTDIPVEQVFDIDGNPVPAPGLRGNRLSAVLNFLDSTGEIKILSRPRVTVLDGSEASFENVEQLPYQEGGLSTSVIGDANRVVPLRVSFIDVGTILRVLPRITEDDNILMEIFAEDSTAENVQVISGDLESTIPQKRSNTTETKVMVHDHQTIVIGGLRATSIEDDVERVPFLGDLPFLGRLFKDTRKDNQHRELLVFITPTIVDEFTKPEAKRLADMDAETAQRIRDSQKSLIERVHTRLTQGENEIGVSIGATGSLHSAGKLVTLDDLDAQFTDPGRSAATTTVVIRAHPNAPTAVADAVRKLAEDAGLKVETDDQIVPFVPVQ